MDKGQIGIRQNQYKPERVVANRTPSTVKRLNKQEVVEQLRARGSKYSLMGRMFKKSFVFATECFTGTEDGQEMHKELCLLTLDGF